MGLESAAHEKAVSPFGNCKMNFADGQPPNFFANSFVRDFAYLQDSLSGSSSFSGGEMLFPALPLTLNNVHRMGSDIKHSAVMYNSSSPRMSPSKFNPVPGSSHVCRVCSKTFRASSLLDIHMRVHVGAKPFVCPICGHRATQKGNLKLHMKKHHGADLPPHIDLVPDSGIWGHPQEIALSASLEDELTDASGKKKQVAQAVSSLLNEEIVELIKKCQNNVGQGMTGRITESLEDFIRIAKSKADGGAELMDTITDTSMLKHYESIPPGRPKKKRNSSRFKPYSPNSSQSMIHLSARLWPESEIQTENKTKCLLCGKSFKCDARHIAAMNRICDTCTQLREYSSIITSQLLLNKSSQKGTIDSDSPATINGVITEMAAKPSNKKVLSCNFCGSVFVDKTELKTHKLTFHRPKSEPSFESTKTEFLNSLGLVSKSSSNSHLDEKRCSRHVEGLNPILSSAIWNDSKNNDKSVIISETKPTTKIISGKKQVSLVRASSESKLQISSQNRASPGVLNMLRQTVLNSVEQKMVSSNSNLTSLKPTSEVDEVAESDDVFKKDIDANLNQISKSPFRNPAMQSLAEIGKSLPAELSEQEPELLNHFSDVMPSILHDTNRPRLSGSLSSLFFDIQEQENGGFKCQFCPKWFKYRSVLEIHMRSHTGERPYKCPYCEYAGTQQNCLKLHIQRHHPREYNKHHNEIVGSVKPPDLSLSSASPDVSSNRMSCFSPVECPICGRVSPSPGYLKIHMRSHKKSLDHVCPVCGRGFKEYWYLSTHLKTHERELGSMNYNLPQSQSLNTHLEQSNFPLQAFSKSAVAQAIANIQLQNKLLDTAAQSSREFELLSCHKQMKENEMKKHLFSHEFEPSRRQILSNGNVNNSNHIVRNSPVQSEWLSKNDSGENEHSMDKMKIGSSKQNKFEVSSIVKTTSHTSRRKASCPSRITSVPYKVIKSTNYHNNLQSQNVTISSADRRKSRPRKNYQGTYLAPTLNEVNFGTTSDEAKNTTKFHSEVDSPQFSDKINDELPLDLSCSTGKWKSGNGEDQNNDAHEEPLNLSKS